MTITLYPDQQDMIDRVIASIARGNKSVLLQSATGSGKSYMATEIVRRAYNKGSKVWFSVPRRELIRQMSGTFMDFEIPHTFIAAGHGYNRHAPIQVCSTQTLIKRINNLEAPKLAIIDETHVCGEGLDKIIKWLKDNGTVILGLSASPWRTDGRGLGRWYDDMVCGPSIRELINNKRLSEYKAYAPNHVDLSQIKITAGDYAKGQLAEKMEQDRVLIGNSVKHYKTHAMGLLGVTFAVSRAHSELLAQCYRDNGVPAMHIDGETPEDERRRIARAFAKREILQLCNAELLTFGYDLQSASGIKGAAIQCMNDCQPTKSKAKQLQKNGRNLRYDGTLHKFFDHANNIDEHGLPCDEHEWTLEDREVGTRKSGERVSPVKQCDKCYFCHKPAPACPNCGNVYEVQSRQIEEIEGELAEIAIQAERKAKRQEVGKCRTQDELQSIADERGYHWAWVKKQCEIKGIHYRPRSLGHG